MRAPTNVPALNIATTWDDCAGEILGSPSAGSIYPVLNCLRKAFMASIPEMVLYLVSPHRSHCHLPRLLTPYRIRTAALRMRRTARP